MEIGKLKEPIFVRENEKKLRFNEEEQYEETERIHDSISNVKRDLAKAVSLLDIRPNSI